MSIRFNSNFVVAQKVLAAVNKTMPKAMQKDCVVEAYCNGREQGLSIWFFNHNSDRSQKVQTITRPKRVCFSENRNSDDIIVYAGDAYNFSMQGNVPGDEEYKERKYFRYDQVSDAAKYIIDTFAKDLE
jgi:hypothetical protein